MVTTINHWYAGKLSEGSSGRFDDVTDPATGQVAARVALASAEETTVRTLPRRVPPLV